MARTHRNARQERKTKLLTSIGAAHEFLRTL
jgi:hypothetical protein